MEEKQKKRLISLLLLISCIVSMLLLAFTPPAPVSFLKNLEQADSLIVHDLKKFGVAEQQIDVKSVLANSGLTRKVYSVSVPEGLSKTQLHLELAKSFYPYDISAPAKIVFPQKDVTIHLVYNQTIVRTVSLETDPDLVLKQSPGSILIALDSAPSELLLEKVIDFGEPIPLVLVTEDPIKAKDLAGELSDEYPHILFWLKDSKGNDVLNNRSSRSWPTLERLEKTIPNATVLSFPQLTPEATTEPIQLLSATSLSYVDVSEAVLLDPDIGRAAFRQELTKFVRKARRNEHPVAIVIGNDQSLEWLKSELFDFKKTGLNIVLPRKQQF